MESGSDQQCAIPTVLVLTRNQALSAVISRALEQRAMKYCTSDTYDDVDNNYCLIIAGPDMDSTEIGLRLRDAGGIPPCLLLLRDAPRSSVEEVPVRCCRCQTLMLPMDIFRLPDALDRLLVVD